ncbi:MAG: hypothetical protein ACLP7O_13280 [Terracidiphilus sp.]
MKSAIVAIAVLAITSVPAGDQQAASAAQAHGSALHWLVEGTQELGGKDRIGVTDLLTPDERAALIDSISFQLRPGRKIGDATSEKELLDAVNETRVKLVDLNSDGIPEVIAQASGNVLCSPTGNCTIWVFMRSGGGYTLILRSNAIQTFAIRPSRTNGFNDLVLGQHGSAYQSDLFLYRFVNGQYRRDSCYHASWEKLVGDEWQMLKDPIITPCKR